MKNGIAQLYRNTGDYEGILFLDRDGTINREVDYLHRVTDIEILPTVIDGIKLLNENKIAVIVITNQAVISRGFLTIDGAKKMNDEIVKKLSAKKAYIDAVYFCPHHPNADLIEFRTVCRCRKPNIGLFNQAVKEYKTSKIYGIIGDKASDILAGKNMKIRTAIVKTGFAGKDLDKNTKPDFICDPFISAVKVLIQK